MQQLEESETLPAYVPLEGEARADLLTSLLEQIRYERSDGVTLPTRVVLTASASAKPVLAETLIEDTINS